MKTRSLWHSFQCAFAGLRDLLADGRNARIHVVVAVTVVAVGAWLGISRTEWAILALTIGTVLAAEAVNSSIEHLVDLVSPEHHDLAGRAKDCAAAAVLLLAVAAIISGLLIFGPPFLSAMRNLVS
jgi:diacylglycerol kinase (ATP)